MGLMFRLLLLVSVLVLSIGLAPLQAQTSDQPTGTIAVSDSAEQDAAIANRIREIFMELDGYEDVTVAVNSGIVTLRGTAIDGPAVTRLNEIAGRIEGVVAIENRVQEPPTSRGGSILPWRGFAPDPSSSSTTCLSWASRWRPLPLS